MINRGDSAENEGRQTLGRDLRLLELIVDNIDDLIAVIDSQGRRVWNNAAYARVLGYSVVVRQLVLLPFLLLRYIITQIIR